MFNAHIGNINKYRCILHINRYNNINIVVLYNSFLEEHGVAGGCLIVGRYASMPFKFVFNYVVPAYMNPALP